MNKLIYIPLVLILLLVGCSAQEAFMNSQLTEEELNEAAALIQELDEKADGIAFNLEERSDILEGVALHQDFPDWAVEIIVDAAAGTREDADKIREIQTGVDYLIEKVGNAQEHNRHTQDGLKGAAQVENVLNEAAGGVGDWLLWDILLSLAGVAGLGGISKLGHTIYKKRKNKRNNIL